MVTFGFIIILGTVIGMAPIIAGKIDKDRSCGQMYRGLKVRRAAYLMTFCSVALFTVGCSQGENSDEDNQATDMAAFQYEERISQLEEDLRTEREEKDKFIAEQDALESELYEEIAGLIESLEAVKSENTELVKDNREVTAEFEDLKSNFNTFLEPKYNTKMKIIKKENLIPPKIVENDDALELDFPVYEKAESVKSVAEQVQLNAVTTIDIPTSEFRIVGYVESNPLLLLKSNNQVYIVLYKGGVLELQYAIEADEEIGIYYVFDVVETERYFYIAMSTDLLKVSKETGDVVSHSRFSDDFPGEEITISDDGEKVSFIVWEDGMYITDSGFTKCYMKVISRHGEEAGMESCMARYPVFDSTDSDYIYIKNLGYEWSYGIYGLNIRTGEMKGVLGENISVIHHDGERLYFAETYGNEICFLDIKEQSITVVDGYSGRFDKGCMTGNYVASHVIGSWSVYDEEEAFTILDTENDVLYYTGLIGDNRLHGVRDGIFWIANSCGSVLTGYELVSPGIGE